MPTQQRSAQQMLPSSATKTAPQSKIGLQPLKLRQGQNLAMLLQQNGWTPPEIQSLLTEAKKSLNLKKMRAGMTIRMSRPNTTPKQVVLQTKPQEDIWFTTNDLQTTTEIIELPVTKKKLHYRGLVQLSLWESAKQAGMPPSLIDQLADVFAWQIDFAKEVRSGDRWKITVERNYARNNATGEFRADFSVHATILS